MSLEFHALLFFVVAQVMARSTLNVPQKALLFSDFAYRWDAAS
jgi:hypothetical protein